MCIFPAIKDPSTVEFDLYSPPKQKIEQLEIRKMMEKKTSISISISISIYIYMGSIFWGLQKMAQSLKIWSIHWLIIIVPSADGHFEGYTPFYTPKMSYQVSYYYYYYCYYYFCYLYIYMCVCVPRSHTNISISR